MTNVEFRGFRQNYSSGYSSLIRSSCGNNFALRPHPDAVSSVAGHYLQNCECTSCDADSKIHCDSPNPKYLKDCGQTECTGKSNYLVKDNSGTFLGQPSIILPNNERIGGSENGCSLNPVMNGHICTSGNFAVLEYESKARDYNRRIIWPVKLKADGSSYFT